MENSNNTNGSEDDGMLKVNLTLTSSPSSPRVEISVPNSGITSSKLREVISNATKIPLSSLKLIFRGRLIADKNEGDVVTEYKLEDGCVLHCMGKPDTSSSTTTTTTAGASVSMGSTATTTDSSSQKANVTSNLEDALKSLKTNCGSGDKYMTAVTTLEKIVSNITGHPMEEKYRKVKRDNAAFQRRLGSFTGSREVMLAVGFQEQDFNGVAHYVLVPSPEAWPSLVKAHDQIKAAVTQAKAATQTFTPPPPMNLPGNLPNMGSMPPIMPGMESAMQNLMSNPQQLQAMLQNPMVRNMMESDPRFANNPMLRQSLDALANNPQMMEQMSQMMADPGMRSQINNMMRQQQSSTMPSMFPPNPAPPSNNANSTANNTNNNNTNSSNGDGDQTEEEMIAEAIARSLREQ